MLAGGAGQRRWSERCFGGLVAVLLVLAFIIPGEGGESAGRWTHSAASQAPADLGAVCTVL